MDASLPTQEWQWLGKDDAGRVFAEREGRDTPLSTRTLRDRTKKGKLESRIREGRVEYRVAITITGAADIAGASATDAESTRHGGGHGSALFAEVLVEVRGERDYLRQQNAELLAAMAAKDEELHQSRERLDGVLALFATMRQPLPTDAESVRDRQEVTIDPHYEDPERRGFAAQVEDEQLQKPGFLRRVFTGKTKPKRRRKGKFARVGPS